MDTPMISAAEAARRLGTSLPRVKRAITREGVQVQQGPGGRVCINHRAFEQLRHALGQRATVGELSLAEGAVLAALARAPLGLVSARAVAERAGVSPTAASRAVAVLSGQGLVTRERTHVAAGHAREVDLISPAVTSRRWRQLAPALARIEPPGRRRARAERVPARLRHLFWNTAESQLDVGRAGGYVARRLLQTADPQGLAWGAEHLSAEDWDHAATSRGLDPRTRSLARNLAADARARAAEFAATLVGEGTLNGIYGGARVQFLHARNQTRLAAPTRIAEMPVAAVEDILAMKLKVIGDRGELRNYFDVMSIEQRLGRTAEEGLALYRARYGVPAEHATIGHILLALGHFDDVDDDELLPVGRDVIEKYWRRRQPQVLKHLNRFGS